MRTRINRESARGAVIPDKTRRKVRRRFCQICGAEYDRITSRYSFARATRTWLPRQHIDHIVPARYVHGNSLGDPNAIENLVSLCHRCNLAKKGAEDRLFLGDALSFVALLQARGWGYELKHAAKFYGLLDLANLVRL